MEVEIKIKIEADYEDFNKQELRFNVFNGFPEITGYDIMDLDIETDE
jgi:hypothetical protein